MKTKKILLWLGLIGLVSAISYNLGLSWHTTYCSGARVFFVTNRVNDIKDTIWAAFSEELLWRFIPLIIVSLVLSFIKYDSSRKKKYISCCIAFIVIVLSQIQFGSAHYNQMYESADWMLKHILWQGSMGMFYALVYNIAQYFSKKEFKIHLISSHIIGAISSFIVHASVNSLLIIHLTF